MKETSAITAEIRSLTEDWEPRLRQLSDEIITQRRNNQQRTIKQILGHLIDSTSNNTHRVVHLQYQESPFSFPNYATNGNNDRWIAIQDYQHEDWNNMIQLWKYSLLHFCHVINNLNDDNLENEWISGPNKKITLRTMIIDFPRHLKLHLKEIDYCLNCLKNKKKRLITRTMPAAATCTYRKTLGKIIKSHSNHENISNWRNRISRKLFTSKIS